MNKKNILTIGVVIFLLFGVIGIGLGVGESPSEGKNEFELSVEYAEGGDVTIEYDDQKDVLDESFSEEVWSEDIEANTNVTLTAEANDDFEFIGWEGDHPENRSKEKSITFEMDSDREIKARFDRIPEYVDYIPQNEDIEINYLEEDNEIEVEITFFNSGFRVKDWGNVTRTEERKEVNANIQKQTGPALGVLTNHSNVYELGEPEDCFEFVFKAHNTTVRSQYFCGAVEIVEEAGFEVPEDAELYHREGNISVVEWFEDFELEEERYLFEIEDGEIIKMITSPSDIVKEESLTKEDLPTLIVENLEEIDNIELPEDMDVDDYKLTNEALTIQSGWNVTWEHEIDDVPVEDSYITAELSPSHEVVYYSNNWVEIDKEEITTAADIDENEAVELAKEAFSQLDESDEDIDDLYDEVNVSLSIAEPGFELEEKRDHQLIYEVEFADSDDNILKTHVDSKTGEILADTGTIYPTSAEDGPMWTIFDILPVIIIGVTTLLVIGSASYIENKRERIEEEKYDRFDDSEEIDWSEAYTRDKKK